MHALRFLVLSSILLVSLGLTACAKDTDLAGSAVEPSADSVAIGGDGVESREAADSEWPVASAQAILDAIAPIKVETIDMKSLNEIAAKQGLGAQVDELERFLQRISNGDLGSGRRGISKAHVAIATDLTKGKSVPTQDLRGLLQAIISG